MIRRISHILLSSVLLILTTGVTVHQHYCQGYLIKTNLLHEPASCCDGPSDCCSNESETYLLQQDFVDFTQVVVLQNISFEAPVLHSLVSVHPKVIFQTMPTREVFRPPDLGTVLARLQVFCL